VVEVEPIVVELDAELETPHESATAPVAKPATTAAVVLGNFIFVIRELYNQGCCEGRTGLFSLPKTKDMTGSMWTPETSDWVQKCTGRGLAGEKKGKTDLTSRESFKF